MSEAWWTVETEAARERAAIRRRVRRNIRHLVREGEILHDGKLVATGLVVCGQRGIFEIHTYHRVTSLRQIINALKHGEPV